MNVACKICNNTNHNKEISAKEMMFGFKDEFLYFECSICGCLQIVEIPENISKYYPHNYYSYNLVFNKKRNILKSYLNKKMLQFYSRQKNLLGWILSAKYKNPYKWLPKEKKITIKTKILDVGCGSGDLLLSLKEAGFLNLNGVDPFIQEEIFFPNGITIFKKEIMDLDEGNYDFIMMHHSFEHMSNPLEVLHSAYTLLNKDGCLLIRIPVAGSYASRKYGINWVQLDAPRHFFLHTIKSIAILAENAGFKVKNIIFDSSEFQFLSSELYLKNIPLNDPLHKYPLHFSKAEINSFKIKAKELNSINDGDSACFYLYKK
ncbi:MAG TPA: class I SAM-dependent methyltransferase [Ferruginibacter sp.]|nr:class I SAM-dependent methyltransferase [Ferruginibacter sp.]